MRYVKNAQYVDDYKIIILFDNMKKKIVDLKNHLIGKVFEPLKDTAYFKRFRVDHDIDTIVWENGADLSPDFLYEIGQEVDKR